MKYKREEVVSNLYETSKSREDNKYLLSKSAEIYAVYHLDKLKEKFCEYYRHSDSIKSCDAYYYDQYNNLVIEFKNAHHMKMREYYNEIEMKMLDTHMLLSETLWKNRKAKDIAKKVNLIVVYNDAMNYGKGLCAIGSALNDMKPIQGNQSRNTNNPKIFENEEEYKKRIAETKEKYQTDFYKEIDFIDKKDFETDYINSGYFITLEIWSEICRRDKNE